MKPLEDMGRYATVVIDPPWDIQMMTPTRIWGNPMRSLPYPSMSVPEICDMSVESVLDDEAMVFLWTTNRLLQECFKVIEAWGLEYWFTFVWHKNNGMQTPNNPRHNAEFAVVGRRGVPKFREIRMLWTTYCWDRGNHSEKPEGFYDLLRRVTPAPRLDIFGRRAIGGFDSWGLEAPTENHEPDMFQGVLVD